MSDTHAEIDALLGVVESPQRKARNAAPPIPLPEGRRHARKVRRRVFHNASRTKAAIETLTELPAEGETHHYVMAGHFDSFDLVDAILARAKPARIDELYLASLGFNSANTKRLIQMLDAGEVGRCMLMVSVYFESDPKEATTCYQLARELPARGGWYCACRNHAKLILAALSDGRRIVIESSANLRSCRATEQFAITSDAGLYQFHEAWIQEARANAEAHRRRDR